MPPNERLRICLERSGHTMASLALHVGTDPKTVARWVSTGRVPHRRNAHAVARVLGADVRELWPALERRARRATDTDLVAVHRQRPDVSAEQWRSMFAAAERTIDILVYAALFLHEQIPGWNDLLKARAEDGVHVRVLIGDPDCEAVRVRGGEERFGHGIQSRCHLAAMHYRPLAAVPGVSVRVHSTTLYNSLYRADDHMYVNTHMYGVNAYGNPLLRLKRTAPQGLFDAYAASMDAVWCTARPLGE
ncbi:helix-turn-helix transcriptional regulator [Nocardiopsis sp. HUAS JQ3]|uniref:helix-turn-helix domain-containing protein n=1 Tax=Nocardiopsis sp. HUAS JQ3 TaxID=3061629 RepID=UPI0023A9AACA|nr:helix-turn-helix transcriptional regulator [Nocardiopsis sp. HUAS JQ3]WDZ91385.1 helix-turn-helix transcriptional regulator [Nocardiopsis sp. HUAS JQ3]